MNFIAPSINIYVCTNACLKHSKPSMSAQQPFVLLFSCFDVVVLEYAS